MNQLGTGAWIRRSAVLALTMTTIIAAGCRGGDGGGDTRTSAIAPDDSIATPIPSPFTPEPIPGDSGSGNTPPAISAAPTLKAAAGVPYNLTPEVQDPDGDALAFAVENRPAWAQFSTVTGELSGTPSVAQAGTYKNVKISVSDGKASAALPSFTIVVSATGAAAGSGVTLQWEPPTQTLDGKPLGELAGFRIHYGKDAEILSGTIEVKNPGLASYVVDDLPPGKYYFAIRAITATGEQSLLSNVIAKVIG